MEKHWRDVHIRLTAYAADALQARLPDDLVARMEERVYVETAEGSTRAVMPDVSVVEDPAISGKPTSTTLGGISVAEPIVIHLESEPVTEPYIVISDSEGRRVVTAIEFLSPANKAPGPGRESYEKKRAEMLAGEANFVEIDLVRSGDWRAVMRPYQIPATYHTPYRACIRRATNRDRAELYPITLRQSLPTIRIPLRPDDRDVPLDLQSLIEQAWRNGRYDRTDYTKPCEPPLDHADAEWVAGLFRSAGIQDV